MGFFGRLFDKSSRSDSTNAMVSMKSVPLAEKATPFGLLHILFDTIDSLKLMKPFPASAVTYSVGETARIRWLPESATYETPVGDRASPMGLLKHEAALCPSTNDPFQPANVDTFYMAKTFEGWNH